MTNEEKAREITLDYTKGGYRENVYASDLEDALIEMAEWKEQQMIEKAVEWIRWNNENGGCKFDGWIEDFQKEIGRTNKKK